MKGDPSDRREPRIVENRGDRLDGQFDVTSREARELQRTGRMMSNKAVMRLGFAVKSWAFR